MSILLCNIDNIRNLYSVKLPELSSRYNIFYGENGSGKTSILEALHIIGLGRSFRSGKSTELISHTRDNFSLFAYILNQKTYFTSRMV